MKYIITVSLIVVSIIHLLPVSGVLGAKQLKQLYGISFDEPNLEILMRHRAVLFGILGVFLLYAAFVPKMQLVAFVIALVSVVSFLILAWVVGDYNAQIRRVFIADVIALVFLIIGLGSYLLGASQLF